MDPLWILVAFILGFAVNRVGLPPLVGYLIAGFVLQALGVEGGATLEKIADLGVDCVEGEMTDIDQKWLKTKLAQYAVEPANGIENMTKLVSGKQLWNYDNLEPSEKKLVL